MASWIEMGQKSIQYPKLVVEAYVASWIEIEQGSQTPSSTTVEAYVASWIEIQTQRPAAGRKKSRLMWPRGLKCY